MAAQLSPETIEMLDAYFANKNAGKSPKSAAELAAQDAMDAAALNQAGGMDDEMALALMNSGNNRTVPYGGKLSPFQAANDGLRQGMGMYNMLETQKSKRASADALTKYLRAKNAPGAIAPITSDGTNPMAPAFKKDPYSRSELLVPEVPKPTVE